MTVQPHLGNRSTGQFSVGTQVYIHPLSTVFLANNLVVAQDGLTALECDVPAPG